jgi:hypothetical protein
MAHEEVVPGAAVRDVVALVADELAVPPVAVEGVVPGRAEQQLGAVGADELVEARPAIRLGGDVVRDVPERDPVVTVRTVDLDAVIVRSRMRADPIMRCRCRSSRCSRTGPKST